MAMLWKAVANAEEAERLAQNVISAGVPAKHIRILAGSALTDARSERVGSFDDEDTRPERVGSFGDVAPETNTTATERTGSFGDVAPETNTTATERVGSFGDVDRDTVETPGEGEAVASHERLIQLMVDAGLDHATAVQNIDTLHGGRALVLVDASDADHDRVRQLLS